MGGIVNVQYGDGFECEECGNVGLYTDEDIDGDS